MGNLTNTIPFTEMYERVLNISRTDTPNNIDYVKGLVNDVYTRTLPMIEDWIPLISSAAITTVAEYTTGTVAVTVGSNTVTGTGATFTTAMTATDGYSMKIAGNDNVYTFTYASASTGTISPAFAAQDDLTGQAYVMFKDKYSLATDFSRLLKNGSFYYMSGGRYSGNPIKEVPQHVFRQNYTYTPNDKIARIMVRGTDSSGNQTLLVNQPPKFVRAYPYDYIKRVPPMSDYYVGTSAVTNGSATVTGTDTSWSANVSAGSYFRVDGNGVADASKWYLISTVDSDTQITLDTVYGEPTETLMEYTCATIPSVMPYEFHEFIIYEAVTRVLGDQSDTALQYVYTSRESMLSNLKKMYKTRDPNTQYEVQDDGYR